MTIVKQQWVKAAAGGVIGFVVFYLARALAIIVELHGFGLVGGRSLSLLDKLVLYILVPILLVAGAALAAYLIGAPFQRSIITGLIAASAAILLQRSHDNYAPFDWLETAAFVVAALITAYLSTASDFSQWRIAAYPALVALSLLLIAGLASSLGFVISLIAWLILPIVATLLGRLS